MAIAHHLEAIEVGIEGAIRDFEGHRPAQPGAREPAEQNNRPEQVHVPRPEQLPVPQSGVINLAEHPSGEIKFGEPEVVTGEVLPPLEGFEMDPTDGFLPDIEGSGVELGRSLPEVPMPDVSWPDISVPGLPPAE